MCKYLFDKCLQKINTKNYPFFQENSKSLVCHQIGYGFQKFKKTTWVGEVDKNGIAINFIFILL